MPITVFVGPNNSGKSKILNEIQSFCNLGYANANNVIIESIDLSPMDDEEIETQLSKLILEPDPTLNLRQGMVIIGNNGNHQQVNKNNLIFSLKQPNKDRESVCSYFLRYNTIILNGNNRINLVNAQLASNLQKPPTNSFQKLFVNDSKRKEVRRIIYDAF